MTLHSPSRLLLSAIALCLSLTATGCGQTSCIVWNPDEGACPARDKALPFFSDPKCPGSVISVDSDGTFGNDLCCYSVTKDDTGTFSDVVPCASRGTGGAGGSFSTGSAVTGGTGGSFPSCTGCQEALSHNGMFVNGECPGSQQLFTDLMMCLCAGPCTAVCNDNFCVDSSMASQDCLSCLTDTSMMGCGVQFSACSSDV